MSDELLDQFVAEARELTQQASDELMALERDPHAAASVASAFRAIHTLKGSAGLFDLAPMGSTLHAAEDVMGAIQSGRLALTAAAVSALLGCMAQAEAWVDAVAATGRLPDDAEAVALEMVRRLGAAGTGAADPVASGPVASAPVTTGPAAPAAPERDWADALAARNGTGATTAFRYTPRGDAYFMGDDPLALVRTVPGLVALEAAAPGVEATEHYDPFTCTLLIEGLSTAPAEAVRHALRFVADQVAIVPAREAPPQPASPAAAASRVLRIEAERIDALADLVGELLVANNRLRHLAAAAGLADPGLARALALHGTDVERLTGALHRAVTAARMMPLGQVFRRLPRLLRDIAARLGKEVRLEVAGAAVEADKTIADGLFEPLMHLLRNAVDHGIERPEVRLAAGKPRQGCITLVASRVGDHVSISIADDGAGIDLAALRRAAAKRGLFTPEALAAMDEASVADLVFMPGFSTAAAVTDVSGRGVGMDAVRTALHGLGGRVALSGAPGRGTTVRLMVPQAVAMTTVVEVEAGGQRYGVPIEMISETVSVPRARIIAVQGGAACVLRDRTLPVMRLDALLGSAGPQPPGDAKLLILQGAADRGSADRVGLEVDGFGARLDAVVRPMDGLLAGLPGVRGSVLRGDGQVLLVLDLPELVG